jgi:quinol monooxygenase YgiN
VDEVVVVATFLPAPGSREEVRAALEEAIPAVHAEDGCLLYALHEGEDALVLLERWTSGRALDVHNDAPSVARLRARLEGHLSAPIDVVRLVARPVGTPEQGRL